MASIIVTRRLFVVGTLSALPGCNTLAALNDASSPLPTYDLLPVAANTQGGRNNATFLVAEPVAPAALETDRLLIRPEPATITYLPDARWSENLPALVQSLIVRSVSSTGRVGYVGPSDGGPIPDFAILSRIDRFEIDVTPSIGGGIVYMANLSLNLTILRDADQSVVATRTFQNTAQAADLAPASVVAAFQRLLDTELRQLTDWIIAASR